MQTTEQKRQAELRAAIAMAHLGYAYGGKIGAKRALRELFGGNVGGAGNVKVGQDTATFNISETYNRATKTITCPEFLAGTCQMAKVPGAFRCYAVDDVRQYTAAARRDQRSAALFASANSAKYVAAAIYLSWWTDGKAAGHNLRWLRFNVRGGVASLADILRQRDIADAFFELTGAHAYTYCSRHDLLTVPPAFDNLTITGSGFMVNNAFVARPADQIPTGAPVCGGDCRTCHICKTNHNVTVYCAVH